MIDIMYSLGTNNEELINRFLFVSTRGACSGGICARAATEERHVGSVERKKWIRVVLSLLSWEVLHRLDEDQSAQRGRTYDDAALSQADATSYALQPYSHFWLIEQTEKL